MDGYPDTDGPLDDTPAPIATPEEVRAEVKALFTVWLENDSIPTEMLELLTLLMESSSDKIEALKDENERLTADRAGMVTLYDQTADALYAAEAQVVSLTETVGKLREAGANAATALDKFMVTTVDGMTLGDVLDLNEARKRLRAALTPTEPEAKETTNG